MRLLETKQVFCFVLFLSSTNCALSWLCIFGAKLTGKTKSHSDMVVRVFTLLYALR